MPVLSSRIWSRLKPVACESQAKIEEFLKGMAKTWPDRTLQLMLNEAQPPAGNSVRIEAGNKVPLAGMQRLRDYVAKQEVLKVSELVLLVDGREVTIPDTSVSLAPSTAPFVGYRRPSHSARLIITADT